MVLKTGIRWEWKTKQVQNEKKYACAFFSKLLCEGGPGIGVVESVTYTNNPFPADEPLL